MTDGELQRLRDEFLIAFTYNSNAIEGNTLTLQETALILNEGITIAEKPLRDHLEIIGHKEAYFYVEALVKEKVPLSEKVIQTVHSIVLMDKPQDRGVYRSVPVRILGAAHTPPEPWAVPVQMELLLTEYAGEMQTLHPIERAALFHLRFEGIHPFIDGNGRTGRLLLNLELMQQGYPAIDIKFADRRKYYDSFAAYHRPGGDAEPMVALVAGYVEAALERYCRVLA